MRDNHFEEDEQIISRETIENSIAEGEAYRIVVDGKNAGGFHIVEFYNSHHPDPNAPDSSETLDEQDGQFSEGMFRFEKRIIK